MMKRCLSLLLALLLPLTAFAADLTEADLTYEDLDLDAEEETELGVYEIDGSRTVTITCTGDFTIGGDNYHKKGKKFYTELKKNNDDINFTMANVREIFRKDDLTIVNFEGTFTDTKYVPEKKKGNDFLFNISPTYANVLSDNFIEAVTLENNHIMDHGDEGLEDTKSALQEQNVIYSTSEALGEY